MNVADVSEKVYLLLKNESSGHGFDHIGRVLRLSLRFAREENADTQTVSLIALLHDTDDYKLFGTQSAETLPNARRILYESGADEAAVKAVTDEIKRIGYSKALKGIRPLTPEGKCVSDADMCDAMGADGILRAYAYGLKKGRPFFDPSLPTRTDVTYESYAGDSSTGVDHMFEKILRLKGYMLTPAGKREAQIRHSATAAFLEELFREEDAPEWQKMLRQFT